MIIFTPQRLRQIIYGCLACCVFSGCLSTKDIIYFQSSGPGLDEVVSKKEDAYTLRVKPSDILSITVSSLDRDDREIFNPLPSAVTQYSQMGGFIVLQPIRGFTVDTLGNIQFPQIGEIYVAGLTLKEIEIKLTDQIQQYVKSPTVSVHIANYVISLLGEVTNPAQYVISNNQITLPEALALAGDLTIYGNRKNVLIIREMGGWRRFARVDLTDRNLFDSPYYYLRSGDCIYVEPTKGRMTFTDRTYQLAPVVISSISLLLLVISTLIK